MFMGTRPWDIELDVNNSTTSGRDGGESATAVDINTVNGLNIFEPLASYKLRTGIDTNGSDPE